MIGKLQRNVRAIHDLERAVRVWEMGRDSVQQALNEEITCCEKQGGSIESNPVVAEARSNIATFITFIVAAKARIDELERGNQKQT